MSAIIHTLTQAEAEIVRLRALYTRTMQMYKADKIGIDVAFLQLSNIFDEITHMEDFIDSGEYDDE
jgi:O-acetylhomoserine/O-acetylserine sulfhydrylase-like pyridoxal-dependent enzyme